MSTEKEETEGNLITALVAFVSAPKNMFKATALSIFDHVAGTNDSRSFMDRFSEFMDKDCEPYATKKRRD